MIQSELVCRIYKHRWVIILLSANHSQRGLAVLRNRQESPTTLIQMLLYILSSFLCLLESSITTNLTNTTQFGKMSRIFMYVIHHASDQTITSALNADVPILLEPEQQDISAEMSCTPSQKPSIPQRSWPSCGTRVEHLWSRTSFPL